MIGEIGTLCPRSPRVLQSIECPPVKKRAHLLITIRRSIKINASANAVVMQFMQIMKGIIVKLFPP